MPSVVPENDSGTISTGLRKIRQQPPSLERSDTFPRSHSMTYTLPSSPSSPTLSRQSTNPSDTAVTQSPPSFTGEDLTRFVAESLHSFSFANQSDDFVHQRQNILKRSIDFLKDMPGWNSNSLGIAKARAKLSGDEEIYNMLELLDRAKSLSGKHEQRSDPQPSPMTGPALAHADNPFDKSFEENSTERSGNWEAISFDGNDDTPPSDEDDVITPTQESLSVKIFPPPERSTTSPTTAANDEIVGRPRRTMKRTYTDVAPLSLQNKLEDALSHPYLSQGTSLLTPTADKMNGASASPVTTNVAPIANARGAPSTQAIFTTDISEPWTITAANDLGCLIFGLSKTEFRRMSVLEMFRQDKRKWLADKLKTSRPNSPPSPPSPVGLQRPPNPRLASMGGSMTARLLSKPSSRESKNGRLVDSKPQENGFSQRPTLDTKAVDGSAELPSSRGVLLCGDVLPISKRNGAAGSATLWVQEKRSNLIWVLEEIAEDVAFVSVDEVGCVTKASGACEAVWGMERVRRGMDITRLLPGIPRLKGTNTGALDYGDIAILRRFTARTANDISTPVTVDKIADETTFRVSSFPHIAGMMVLNSSSLKIKSCNTVVADTLFGRVPNGLSMNDVVPDFDKMLEQLVEDDKVQLVEGMVIPEHSFRRARAMLALREGKEDAAAVFLRPSGLPALHRDGAEIMVDVQMRVVKSESLGYDVANRPMEEGQPISPLSMPSSEVVFALWVTYSRVLHAVNHGVGPISPLVSRPGTPPHQPRPRDAPISASSDDSPSSDDDDDSSSDPPTPHLSPPPPNTQPLTPTSSASTKIAQPVTETRVKRTINDYTILEDMGAGAYGQVKLARHKTTNNKVVIKYVTKARILVDTWTRDRRLGTVPLEIHVLDYLARTYSGSDGNRVYHPNIVQMMGFFEDNVNYYIEMVPHGLPGMDLFDYIELRADMTEGQACKIFRQVAEAVRFLHVEAGVVHRDIKDENVILDRDERIRLVDFGSSSYVRNGPFDVFVGTIGELRNPLVERACGADCGRLRCPRGAQWTVVFGAGARCLGDGDTLVHDLVQRESVLLHRRDYGS